MYQLEITEAGDCEADEINEELKELSIIDIDKPAAQDPLAVFRQQWQLELEPKSKNDPGLKDVDEKKPTEDETVIEDSVEEQAKRIFLKGVEHERNGKLYDAIPCYRQAVHLVPNIENKVYEMTKAKAQTQPEPVIGGPANGKPAAKESPTPTKLEQKEVVWTAVRRRRPNERRSRSLGNVKKTEKQEENGIRVLSKIPEIMLAGWVCQPEFEQQAMHISQLPQELILELLRWVVSSDLDLTSLERCATVCRGLYNSARDPDIWRMACIKTWGIHCGALVSSPYTSWRHMYVERPRLRHNGIYISKTTYMRSGEQSFQDQFYRPWFVITYYRYFRFFADGTMLMMTTSEEPAATVSQLRYHIKGDPLILNGHYRLHDDRVMMIVKKRPSAQQRHRSRCYAANEHGHTTQTYHIELQILPHRNRRNAQLVWKAYNVFLKKQNGKETSSNFDLSGTSFPPFWFARVKSYDSEASEPLT